MDLFYILSNLALVISAIYLVVILRRVSKRTDETLKTYFDFCLVFIFIIPFVAAVVSVTGNRSHLMKLMDPLANFSVSIGVILLAMGIKHLFSILTGSANSEVPDNA